MAQRVSQINTGIPARQRLSLVGSGLIRPAHTPMEVDEAEYQALREKGAKICAKITSRIKAMESRRREFHVGK